MKFRISEELQRSLSQAEPWDGDDEDVRLIEVTLEPFSVASAVSEQLGLGSWPDRYSPLYMVLLDIAKALEEPLRQHRAPNARDWSEKLLVPLMENWTVPESIEVLKAIHAEREEVGPVRVDRLARELRTLAYNIVHERLVALLERWKARGDFDLDLDLEQRRAEARRQERRDRAREPRYTPPGRT